MPPQPTLRHRTDLQDDLPGRDRDRGQPLPKARARNRKASIALDDEGSDFTPKFPNARIRGHLRAKLRTTLGPPAADGCISCSRRSNFIVLLISDQCWPPLVVARARTNTWVMIGAAKLRSAWAGSVERQERQRPSIARLNLCKKRQQMFHHLAINWRASRSQTPAHRAGAVPLVLGSSQPWIPKSFRERPAVRRATDEDASDSLD